MSNRTIYNVQYDIPRVNISLPGRQNRTTDVQLRITPGVTEVYEFWFGNQDGVPVTLLPFKIKWVFWRNEDLDYDAQAYGTQDIILSKELDVLDPYEGKVVGILESEDTTALARDHRAVRWGLFMVNRDGQVFPAEVNSQHQRYGVAYIDFESGIPSAEMIKTS